ncbi:MAG TPA: F0F1 ATP synthase subunit A, partial [Candidatus Dojkabacteria bacterium]|nr:F0F1 ATP synthase subunit A [Candidatus Dojkabacteria bacterium]
MEISLAAEKIFNIGNIEITNSIISAFIVVFFIVLGVILIGRKLNIANPGKLQIVLEMLAEGLISQISDVLGMDRTKKIFNFVLTFFVFILISNLFGLLPFVPA